MPALVKADIISQLQKEILPLQGFKPIPNGSAIDVGLGPMRHAFPNAKFPLGAIHEFICNNSEDASASYGFIAGIVTTLMRNNGACIWVSNTHSIFPPALAQFGISPGNIIFVDLKKEKEVLWAMEEALKCNGLAAVIGEIKEINFTESRRLQLAVEQSRVTGFILRQQPRSINTTACLARWKISSLPSLLPGDMPGVGFPRWNVELLKIRNGKPGVWQMEWIEEHFRHIPAMAAIPYTEQQRKTG